MTISKDQLRQVTDEALESFWQTVCRNHPDASTGDLSPEMTIVLRIVAERTIREWIFNNVLAEGLGGDDDEHR